MLPRTVSSTKTILLLKALGFLKLKFTWYDTPNKKLILMSSNRNGVLMDESTRGIPQKFWGFFANFWVIDKKISCIYSKTIWVGATWGSVWSRNKGNNLEGLACRWKWGHDKSPQKRFWQIQTTNSSGSGRRKFSCLNFVYQEFYYLKYPRNQFRYVMK